MPAGAVWGDQGRVNAPRDANAIPNGVVITRPLGGKQRCESRVTYVRCAIGGERMNVQELLSAAKAAQGIPSNYRLARVMGVTDNTLNNWQSGRVLPSEGAILTLASMAGVDPGPVLAEVAAMRQPEGALRAAWLAIAARLRQAGHVAAGVIVALFIGTGGGPDAPAIDGASTASNVLPSVAIRFDNLSIKLHVWAAKIRQIVCGRNWCVSPVFAAAPA